MNSWIIDLTLGLLLLLSASTWIIAILKFRTFRSEARSNAAFAQSFDTARLLQGAKSLAADSTTDYATVVGDGLTACHQLCKTQAWLQADSRSLQESLRRVLRKTMQGVVRRRERGLAELASIGSTAPFIGLFGTVWGIMNALKTISATGQASIDVVAGPIGEALVATAIGIATAVPAVLAYNYFVRQQRVQVSEMEAFADEFVRVALEQQAHWSKL